MSMKPVSLLLALALCLPLAGCQAFKRSTAWDAVMRIKAQPISPSEEPSKAYAEKVHGALLREGVPHTVVTFSYHGKSGFLEGTGVRTAVIYEDPSSGHAPWWLMDEELARPLWLPNGDVASQLRFYVRGIVDILDSKSYLMGQSLGALPQSKASQPPQPRPSGITRITPVEPRSPERDSIATTITAPALYVSRHLPWNHEPEPAAAQAPVEPKAHAKRHGQAHGGSGSHSSAIVEPTLGGGPTAEEIFEGKHGTPYNPASLADRKKMRKIKLARR